MVHGLVLFDLGVGIVIWVSIHFILSPPFQIPIAVSIRSSVWKIVVNSFLGTIFQLSLCSVDFMNSHPISMSLDKWFLEVESS
jgi:hypothetical protein